MRDVREGPLSLGQDPFSFVADRAAAGMVEPFSPLKPGAIPLTADDPHLIAARGHYYRDAGGIWRDTLDDRKPDKPVSQGEIA